MQYEHLMQNRIKSNFSKLKDPLWKNKNGAERSFIHSPLSMD